MTDFIDALRGVVADVVWQSTLLLGLGLLAARHFQRQPARAHAVLILALAAAIGTPVASYLVRAHGWGLLRPAPIVQVAAETNQAGPLLVTASQERGAASQGTASQGTASNGTASSGTTAQTDIKRSNINLPSDSMPGGMTGPSSALGTGSASTMPVAHAETSIASVSLNTPSAATAASGSIWSSGLRWVFAGFCAAWLSVSLWMLARLARGAWAGRRLIRAAQRCEDNKVLDALSAARRQLRLSRPVTIWESADVHCPLIWCWGRNPRILVPSQAVLDWPAEQWTAVLCHELAHLKRRDHWSTLVGELVCGLLPWQPLAHRLKRQLETTSEQACDDWAVAAGHSAADYAETLLNLVAQSDPALALAALRRSSGTAGRVRHILSQAVPRPERGWRWGLLVLSVACLGVGATALCQRGIESAEPAAPAMKGKMPAKGGAASTASLTDNLAAAKAKQKVRAHGQVVDPAGKPVADATVVWEFTMRLPGGNYDKWDPHEVVRCQTDASGNFALETEVIPAEVLQCRLVARAKNYGLRGHTIEPGTLVSPPEPIQLTLEEPETIEGTIFQPDGEPVVGAEVHLTSITHYVPKDEKQTKSWYLTVPHQAVLDPSTAPDFWPAPIKTDAEGHFQLSGVVPKGALASLIVLAPNFVNTRVQVATPNAQRWDREQWRDKSFSLVLETPYEVEGQFVDAKTKKPIPGTEISVQATMNGRGWNRNDASKTVSDENGHYRLLSNQGDFYFVEVHPPLGYPGVNNSFGKEEVQRLAGKSRKVKYTISLRPGLVLRGRVVDQATGTGVSGAKVIYQLAKGRKLGTNSYFWPVTTGDDGSFELTGVDGKGTLVVDAPDKGYFRIIDDNAPERRGYSDYDFPHAKFDVDIPQDGQQASLEIPLRKGRVLVANVLDPAGKPVSKLHYTYDGMTASGRGENTDVQDGVFRIDGAEPGRTYRVAFFAPDSNSGAVVELKAPEDDKPLEIKLEPCATVRGRYIYSADVPAPEVTNFSHFALAKDHKAIEGEQDIFNLPYYDNFARNHTAKRESNADGKFELTGIVPGLFYYLSTNYAFKNGRRYMALGPLKPGEIREVGELVIEP